ncbi:MAG: D-aminoacyl-tRNA deacylase [Deltaproteobacteria bacterium]
MRAVVQRCLVSSVTVDGREIGRINRGLVVLLGISQGDTSKEAHYIMDKIINLRIFPDDEGKMNRSLLESGGEVLLVSQFTLYGDARKGRRPSFIDAELPDKALPLFDYCVDYLRQQEVEVASGEFGADMLVTIQNDGPVTILLDSEKIF